MGIENPCPGRPSSACATSLPLMGIENFASAPKHVHFEISLPLMGIENVLPPMIATPNIPSLITPHGDRKPDC